MHIYLATEDQLSEAVGERLVNETGGRLQVCVRMGRRGNAYLKAKLPELSRLANSVPVMLLTDLDRIDCPPTLIRNWLGRRALPDDLLFRVAVRETEAWLMADLEGFADFTGVPPDRLPREPETLADPKETLVNLVRRHGRAKIRSEVVPPPRSRAKVGLGYNAVLCEFVRERWSPERAAPVTESLARARHRLGELAGRHA
jgi:hypothetical protein